MQQALAITADGSFGPATETKVPLVVIVSDPDNLRPLGLYLPDAEPFGHSLADEAEVAEVVTVATARQGEPAPGGPDPVSMEMVGLREDARVHGETFELVRLVPTAGRPLVLDAAQLDTVTLGRERGARGMLLLR